MIDYREEIRANAEPEYAGFSSRLIPGKEGIVGVRIPKLRMIAKEILKDDWESYLEDDMTCFEEEMIRALVIASAPMDTERRIILTEGFLDVIDNWSVSDTFCSEWKVPKKDRDAVWDYFSSLMDSGSEFRMRVSVIIRMDNFMDEEHIDAILEDLASYRNDGFYYKMGAAWAVSVCFIHFRDETLSLLESGRLEPWVQNKSIQKIRESFRVSDTDKEIVSKHRVKM